MILRINEDDKVIYISEFNISSEELIKLAKKFKEYTFESDENISFQEDYSDETEIITLPEDALIDYSTKILCSCEDKNNCERINNCNQNKYIN